MLYIVINDGHEIQWHVGEKIPEIWQAIDKRLPRRFVSEIMADGHELQFILERFKNLPSVCTSITNRPISWHGDFAKFIFANMKLAYYGNEPEENREESALT